MSVVIGDVLVEVNERDFTVNLVSSLTACCENVAVVEVKVAAAGVEISVDTPDHGPVSVGDHAVEVDGGRKVGACPVSAA